MYSPHFFVLHLMMHIQAFTYVKMLKKSFYGHGFAKNWFKIGQRVKKWPNFAKNSLKLPVTKNGHVFFSSGRIPNQHVIEV